MRLDINMTGKQFSVSRETEPKKDQQGAQRRQKDTGAPMWSTQVYVLDDTGGEVITITTAGEKPNVRVGQVVTPVQFEAMPWATNGKNGVAFRATELKPVASAPAKKSE
jgi:hypothetical protein